LNSKLKMIIKFNIKSKVVVGLLLHIRLTGVRMLLKVVDM